MAHQRLASVGRVLVQQNAEWEYVRRHSRLRTLSRLLLGACVLFCPVWIYFLFLTSPEDFPYATSLLMVPGLLIATTIICTFLWRNNLELRLLLSSSILARCASAALFFWMSWNVYGQESDALHYHDTGVNIAGNFTVLGWSAFRAPYWSTNAILNFCGLITVITGDAMATLYIIFSLFAFWGAYFFYRAFTIAFPEADGMAYGYIPLLLPSIMFWSSFVGKDAMAQFFIGLAALGFAKITRKLTPTAVILYVLGVLGMLAVRPHVAAMLALAGLLPYALGRSRGGPIQIAVKILVIPVFLAGVLYIATQAASFLGVEAGNSQKTVSTVNGLYKSSDYGGSAFGSGSLPVRIAEAPLLIYRPLPFEAHNGTSAVAALEGTALLFFTWTRRRKIWRLLKKHWRHPYVAFILCYVTVFSVAFAAATSNFGILVRQRIMMVPIFMMLLFAEVPEKASEPAAPVRRRAVVKPFADAMGNPQPQTGAD